MKRFLIPLLSAILLIAGSCIVAASLPDPAESSSTDPTEETDPPIIAGFFTEGDQTFYRTESGALYTGWLELNSTRYYLDENGVLQTGWLSIDGETYYLNADGSICQGQVEIEDQIYHFTASGVYVVMANPWHKTPDNYEATLVTAEKNHRVDASCADALLQMLTDCRAAGLNAQITSAYRSHDHQIKLFNKKVNYYIGLGYSKAQAEKKAGTSVAVPGTSEHELGLAVDLVDGNYWVLNEKQANTAAQKWLMEHCWEYGFILRYPSGKSDSTGIIYEPWHYRYVGTALAKELQNSGLCLEEYFLSLQ